MKAIFADTFYWVALTNKLDALHEQALALPRSLSSPRIVTTEQVLTEDLNFFAEWGEHFRLKAAGLALYEARPGKGFSLTDCISMETMRREGLIDVLTNDRHFEQEGFRPLFESKGA